MTPEQQQALARSRARLRLQEKEPETESSGGLPDIIGPSMWSGLTFGLSDEIGGAAKWLRSRFPPPWETASQPGTDPYTEGREEVKAEIAAEQKESPIASTATEILGGVASGGAFRAGTGALAQGFSRLPGWLQATGLGTLWGAAGGAAHAEPGERLEGAGVGAGLGAATGLGVQAATKAVASVGKGIRAYASGAFRPEKQAGRLLSAGLEADEVTRIPQRLAVLGPEATLMDVGDETTRRLARGVTGVPGKPAKQITRFVERRSKGSEFRLSKALRTKLSPEDYFDAEGRFLAKLQAAAKKNYISAYDSFPDVMSNSLKAKLKAPAVKRGLREALEIAQNELDSGIPAPVDDLTTALNDPDSVGTLPLQAWDYIKQGLDSLISKPAYSNQFTGKLNSRGTALSKLRKALVNDLDLATGGKDGLYAAARATYQNDAEVIQALRDGADFVKKHPSEIKRIMGNLSASAKEAYRSGAAKKMQEVIGDVRGEGSRAGRLMPSTNMKQRIATVFPDAEFPSFRRIVEAEQLFDRVRNKVTAGSRTAPMQEDIGAVKKTASRLGAIAGSMVPFGAHPLVMAGVGRQIGAEAIGTQPKVMGHLAKMLTTQNRAEQLAILQSIAPDLAAHPRIADTFIRAFTAGAVQQEQSQGKGQ